MSYKRVDTIPFPWEYNDLQKLPIFMREEIYKQLDEFLEEEKQRNNIMARKHGMA